MTATGTTTITSALRLDRTQAPPASFGKACSVCGSTIMLIPAGEGTWVCLNMQRCGT